jgi:hypothetical protein
MLSDDVTIETIQLFADVLAGEAAVQNPNLDGWKTVPQLSLEAARLTHARCTCADALRRGGAIATLVNKLPWPSRIAVRSGATPISDSAGGTAYPGALLVRSPWDRKCSGEPNDRSTIHKSEIIRIASANLRPAPSAKKMPFPSRTIIVPNPTLYSQTTDSNTVC